MSDPKSTTFAEAAEAALEPGAVEPPASKAAEADVRARRLLAEAEARASSLEARLRESEAGRARDAEAALALEAALRGVAGDDRLRAELGRQTARASSAEEVADDRIDEITACLAMIDEVEPAADDLFAVRVARLVENRAAAIEALPEIFAVLRSWRLRALVLEATARHHRAQEELALAFARDAVAAMAAADRHDASLRRRIKALFRAPAARFGHFAVTQSSLSDAAASDLPAAAALLDLGIPDLAFYAAENGDVAEAGVDLHTHFLERGLREGRRAHPDFDPEAYAEANSDVIDAGIPPFAHFLRSGALEGRPEGPGTPEQRLAAVAVSLSGMLGAQSVAGNDAALDVVRTVAGDAPARRGIDAVVAQAVSFARRHGRRVRLLGLGATSQIDRALIAGSGLFDAAWYASNNADAGGEASALAHFLDVGRAQGRAPNAFFDPVWYAQQDAGMGGAAAAFVHYLRYGRVEGRRPSKDFDPGWYAAQLASESIDAASALAFHLTSGAARGLRTSRSPPSRAAAGGAVPARALIRSFGQDWTPLSVHLDHGGPPTVSMITDSVDAHSLFGGVGTAIVFGVLAAQRLGARFRLVTRTTPPLAEALGEMLKAHRIDWSGPTELVHLPVDGDGSLFLGPRDVVVTTSWWNTASALGAVPARQIVYLLQEDERMFYPFGDVRLRCEEVLSRPDLRVVVNSQLLAEHFLGPSGVAGLMDRAVWFDPAFPAAPAVPDPFRDGGKSNFFYARPNHGRNVYWRGLEAIEAAVCEGVLDPAAWNFTFAGSDLPKMTVGGVEPRIVPKVSWMDYAAMTARIDLGLCLMDTPHPSYPPIDLAAAGAVVVTNTHRNKTSLDAWSANIVCSNISVRDLVASIRRAAALALDAPAREANYRRQCIPRDWGRQFEPAFDALFPGV